MRVIYQEKKLLGHGKYIGKLPVQKPFIVFTEIINHTKSYENLILMIMETFLYITVHY